MAPLNCSCADPLIKAINNRSRKFQATKRSLIHLPSLLTTHVVKQHALDSELSVSVGWNRMLLDLLFWKTKISTFPNSPFVNCWVVSGLGTGFVCFLLTESLPNRVPSVQVFEHNDGKTTFYLQFLCGKERKKSMALINCQLIDSKPDILKLDNSSLWDQQKHCNGSFNARLFARAPLSTTGKIGCHWLRWIGPLQPFLKNGLSILSCRHRHLSHFLKALARSGTGAHQNSIALSTRSWRFAQSSCSTWTFPMTITMKCSLLDWVISFLLVCHIDVHFPYFLSFHSFVS